MSVLKLLLYFEDDAINSQPHPKLLASLPGVR